MYNTSITISFNSRLSEIKSVIKRVLEYIRNELPDISDEILFELRLIYSELLINAVAHGNNYDVSKKVWISIKIGDKELYSSISDEGSGFDYTNWFISRNSSPSLLKENGLGLILVNSLADTIAFNDAGNIIEFHKHLHTTAKILNNSAV